MTLPEEVGLTTQTTRSLRAVEPPVGGLDKYFRITERGSTVGREVLGGLVTFVTMSYIIVLNPIILTGAPIESGYKPSFLAVASVTALVAGVMTILMGAVARVPFAMAAGLGINGAVAFQMAPVIGYGGAMGVIVLEGVLATILVATGVRKKLFDMIPMSVKTAIAVGIGLFLAFIGLVDGGVIKGSATAPVVDLTLNSWPDLVFVVTLVLAIVLYVLKVRGALIISIIVGTVLSMIVEAFTHLGSAVTNPAGWALNVPSLEGKNIVTTPDFSVLWHFSITDVFSAGVVLGVMFVFSMLLADLFDTFGTIVGVGRQAGLVDDTGNLPGVGKVLLVDSVGAAAGGLGGVSSNTTYIESAAGVGEGARTGLASVVTGALFLVAMFLSPLAQLVPSEAAAPILVVVGVLILKQVTDIEWGRPEIAFPAGLAIFVMPFTFSITNGIGAAFIAYALLMAVTGKARQVHVLLWVTAVAFVLYFARGPLQLLLEALFGG